MVPAWYHSLNTALASSDELVKVLLVGAIIVTVFLLLFGDRVTRAAWLLWIALP